jgi:quinol monooxygenase YgiN
MVYFVAIHQRAWPDRLDELLATIRQTLAGGSSLHPGRRSTRLFQSLDEPEQLIALSEWTSEDAFEQFRHWPVFVDTIATTGPPPRIEPLSPLLRFERMDRRATVVACSRITAPPPAAGAVLDYLLGEARREVTNAYGLVRRELYRSRVETGDLLLVHGWRSFADLEQFRARYSAQTELKRLGATAERFTGTVAAEFSRLWPRPGETPAGA